MLTAGEIVFPREEPTDWLSNTKWSVLTHTSNIMQTEQAVFGTYMCICMFICVCICVQQQLMSKEAMNLKANQERYFGRFGGRKVKLCNYIII